MDLAGKRALVTGGAVRIGRAIVEALQAEGAEVIVHFQRSDPRKLWKKETEISPREATRMRGSDQRERQKAAGTLSPKTIQADLADPAQCETLLQRAAEQFGKIDILINNAAVFYQTRLADATHELTLKELQINLLAPLALTRGFAQQTGTGKIINLLDRRVTGHDTTCVPYMLSKKGLEELTRLSALELAPGITVNAVAPGAVLPPPGKENDTAWEPAGTIPLDKHPTPADIAEAVLYLLKADSITGQTLFIDGGQNLRME